MTRVVRVGDREADVYDLVLLDRPVGVDLLVRASWDRRVAEEHALACRILRTPTPPAEPPSLQQAVRWIAQLGGFPARASDGAPGPTTLWLGFLRLAELSALFRILSSNDHCSRCGY